MDKGTVCAPGEGGRYKPLELKLAVAKAYVEGEASAAELSKVYGISATTIYDWGKHYRERGEAGLAEIKYARRLPQDDPLRKKLEPEILKTKKEFSWFGIPRLTQWLRRTKLLPVTESQVKKTLKEANLVPKKPRKRRRKEVVRSFERSEPNQLWQTDITMWTVARGQKVYLIGFLDDYSRYIVGWGLHAAQGSAQVLEVLRNAIAQYGAPKEILSDQGRQYYSWRGKSPFQLDRQLLQLPAPAPGDRRRRAGGSLLQDGPAGPLDDRERGAGKRRAPRRREGTDQALLHGGSHGRPGGGGPAARERSGRQRREPGAGENQSVGGPSCREERTPWRRWNSKARK